MANVSAYTIRRDMELRGDDILAPNNYRDLPSRSDVRAEVGMLYDLEIRDLADFYGVSVAEVKRALGGSWKRGIQNEAVERWEDWNR